MLLNLLNFLFFLAEVPVAGLKSDEDKDTFMFLCNWWFVCFRIAIFISYFSVFPINALNPALPIQPFVFWSQSVPK